MDVSATHAPSTSLVDRIIGTRIASRISQADPTLYDFESDPCAVRNAAFSMGWVDLATAPPTPIEAIHELVARIPSDEITDVVLIGQGGSTQAAMALNNLAGTGRAFRFQAIDFVSPLRLAKRLEKLDISRALFIVSSKSGTTIEVMTTYRILRDQLDERIGREEAGGRFIAITDPGSPLARLAAAEGFLAVTPGEASVGGRFSALSVVGLLPAALAGVDIDELMRRARITEAVCGEDAPDNPAIRLAAFLWENLLEGRDKFSLITSQAGRVFGLWVEQLIAESLGKKGRGIIPQIEVDPSVLSSAPSDRTTIVFTSRSENEASSDDPIETPPLPTFHMALDDYLDLGSAFTIWMYAVAILAHLLEVDPFDQPDVAATKRATEFVLSGTLLPHPALVLDDGTEVDFSHAITSRCEYSEGPRDIAEAVSILIGSLVHGDYFAILSYVPFLAERREPMERIRHAVAAHTGVVSCLEIGPRYLHSTGQLHKGGPGNGVFLILSGDEQVDYDVPGCPYTLQQLKLSQARADFAALSAKGRRVLHIHLPDIDPARIAALAELVEAAARSRASEAQAD